MARVRRGTPKQPKRNELADWRVRRLNDAGFDVTLAERLAGDERYDLHALLELIDRGCPPALAARILAPLDESGDR